MESVDVRGLSCPEPVLRVQQIIAKTDTAMLQIHLDSPSARDNVKALLEKNRYKTTLLDDNGEYIITAEK